MFDHLPLHLLNAGQQAEVSDLMGCPEQVRRLEEIGLRRGTVIEMVQAGTPCIVRVNGHKLCFRQSDALAILVRVSQLV